MFRRRKKTTLIVDPKDVQTRLAVARAALPPAAVGLMDEVGAASRDVLVGLGVDMEDERDRQLVAAGMSMVDFAFLLAYQRNLITDNQHRICRVLLTAVMEPVVSP